MKETDKIDIKRLDEYLKELDKGRKEGKKL